MPRERPRWLPLTILLAILLASPCFAAAITVGIILADAYLPPSAPLIAGIAKDAVVLGNALLAFAGATAGGWFWPTRPIRKAKLAAAAGLFGLVAYFAWLAFALNMAGVPI